MEEVMNETQADIVEGERVIFKEVNDDELRVINEHKASKSRNRYFYRMMVSAIIILAVYIFQAVGWVLKDHSLKEMLNQPKLMVDALLKYLIVAVAAFVIYNCISLFYSFVKTQLVSLTENYYILLEAKVEDKYDGKKIHAEGKNRKKKYVLFSCDQGICSKAIETDKKNYKKTKVGDSIVVLKSVTVEGYTLKYLRLNEYNDIYNKYKLNS